MIRSASPPRSIGVLICSYRRPDSLERCLAGLAAQRRMPNDVILVVRDGDAATLQFLARRGSELPRVRQIVVTRPGTVHALNAGLDACATDLLAITDDDTVPHPDWLARIFEHFETDSALGGLGGRDRCHDGTAFNEDRAATVGRISWFGRASGNHHAGFGGLRQVDYLKGANMSYRAEAFAGIRFDTELRGTGAQPFEDACFSMAVRRAGWRLRYDPQVLVDHYPGGRSEVRHYGAVDRVTDVQGFRDHAFNNALCFMKEFSALRACAFVVWSALVGSSLAPGLAQAVRYTPRLGLGSWHRFLLAQQGKLSGYRHVILGRARAPAAARAGGAGAQVQWGGELRG